MQAPSRRKQVAGSRPVMHFVLAGPVIGLLTDRASYRAYLHTGRRLGSPTCTTCCMPPRSTRIMSVPTARRSSLLVAVAACSPSSGYAWLNAQNLVPT